MTPTSGHTESIAARAPAVSGISRPKRALSISSVMTSFVAPRV
jgi:hypothetical protein